MPTYYVMDLDKGIAATMAEHQPQPAEIVTRKWKTDADWELYASQFTRTGFQGGFNYYRVELDPGLDGELKAFAKRTIDVPACYIGGASEWAVYQSPRLISAYALGVSATEGCSLGPWRRAFHLINFLQTADEVSFICGRFISPKAAGHECLHRVVSSRAD
jgi:hypothetical protein